MHIQAFTSISMRIPAVSIYLLWGDYWKVQRAFLPKLHQNRANWLSQNQLALIFVNVDFCCQIVATRVLGRPETLILRGFQDFSLYSHSLSPNWFCLISVIPGVLSDSDYSDYSYSSAYTAFGYQNVITMITGAESLYRMNGFYIHIIL